MLGQTSNDRRLLYPEISQLSLESPKTLDQLIKQANCDICGLRKSRAGANRITKATRYLAALISERNSR